MDVHARPRLLGQGSQRVERFVVESKAGMATNHAAQTELSPPKESGVFRDPGPAPLGASPVSNLVAQDSARPHAIECVCDDVKGTLDEARRGMMINERRRSRSYRVQNSNEGRGSK